MYSAPIDKFICDSDRGDGGVYLYEDYFEWIERDKGNGFRIKYSNVSDIKVILTRKKTVVITLNSGTKVNLYLYNYEDFTKLLSQKVDEARTGIKQGDIIDATVEKLDDDELLNKLERLANLHKSGALTDEEFARAKEKILNN